MYSYEYPHPAVTVDIAVFTQERKPLKLLLIQRANEPHRGEWALPGGFVDIDEDLETAARRELEEETGITVGDIDQLHTFGAPERDPR
jgi:8-oxo-dGTP diphosphatase